MRKLITTPTAICQWYTCIHEAENNSKLILNEDLESYLVFLLMRFITNTTLINSVIAIDFIHGLNSNKQRKIELLREVGDKSLLFSGLFPEIAIKKHVTIDYFNDLGKAAYAYIGDASLTSSAKLYYELSQNFIIMQKILQTLRGNECHK